MVKSCDIARLQGPTTMAPRPLTEEDKTGLLESLTGGVSEAFSDALLLFTDRAGFINGAGSSSPLAQAARAVSQRACRVYARDPGGAGSVRQQSYLADVCGPYLDGLNETPESGGLGNRDITGGQCPGVTYQVRALGNNGLNTNPIDVVLGNFVGPITRNDSALAPPPNCGQTAVLNRHRYVDGGGGVVLQANTCSVVDSQRRLVCTPVTPEPPGGCGPGSEPPLLPPTPLPGLPALSPTITVGLPGFGDLTVEVGINPSGEVTIGLPDIGVEGTVSIGGGGGGGGADPGADPGEPGPSVSPAPGGEASGEAPEGSELVGVLVEVLSAPQNANRFGNNSLQPFRGLAYVRMGYPGRLGVDVSGTAVVSPQFFHAQQRGLTAWSVSANIGFSLRVTPYYRNQTE